MKALTILLPLTALLLCSCDGPRRAEEAEELKQITKEITQLQGLADQCQIEIDDMQAVVEMERAKVDENRDYDQSFLLETLAEQEQKREVRQKLEEAVNQRVERRQRLADQ